MKLLRAIAAAIMLLVALPAAAQDPNAFKPMKGAPIITADDGKQWAVSTFDYGVIAGVGMMMRDPVHPVGGNAYWTVTGEAFRWWQCVKPCGGVPDSQVLSEIVEKEGGTAHFILELVHYANIFMVDFYKFNPAWPPALSKDYLDMSLVAWEFLELAPTLLLITPKG